jgi:autotransporter-associated beta strand protein
MERKQVMIVALVVLIGVAATATLTLAQGPTGTGPALAPLKPSETAFTYQGQLKSGGTVVNGPCDMTFGLYDRASDGGSIGSPIATTVPVTNGLFTVDLDFGSAAFDGTGRWLEIQVNCTGAIVTLPRQWVTPAPMALFASNANQLDGLDATAFAAAFHPHAGADITSGTVADAYIATSIARDSEITPTILANDGPGSGLDADLLDGQHASALVTVSGTQTISGTKTFSGGVRFADGTTQLTAATKPKNVIVVAKSGGDFTTITAARNSITDNSATNPYLIYVAPGIFNERVTMKPFVDIEGAGELATKITFTGSASSNTGTVLGANNAELRFLTVENTGGGAYYAIAICNSDAAPRLTHVTASASGASLNYGVLNASSSPAMTNVIARASGGTYSRGVYNYFSSPSMANVTASASGASYNYGVLNYSSSPTINESAISASGGGYEYGIYNWASGFGYTVRVNNSRVSATYNTILSSDYFTTLVGASQLDGGPVWPGGGTLKCAGVYDENYNILASTCL